MGGHGHGPPYTVPDYKIYNSIEGIPELQDLEKALQRKGLRDPWIRNEVWRYHKGFGTKWARARATFFRGFGVGLGLAIATVAIQKGLGGGDGHGHGDHGEHAEHPKH